MHGKAKLLQLPQVAGGHITDIEHVSCRNKFCYEKEMYLHGLNRFLIFHYR